MRLHNKVIIVTGSTTGIGKAIATRCVQEGAKVIIHGLEADWATQVVKDLGENNAVSLVGDLSDQVIIDELVALSLEQFGRLDAIVNNAAIVASSNIQTTDRAFMEKLFCVNALAPLMLIKAALPHLQKQKGTVLNIGSVNAYSGEPNLLGYSMTKGALMTLTRNLGDVLHRENGVRVNQINPGWVLTETERERKKQHGLPDEWYREVPSVYTPSGRLISPQEIAAAAVYWLADESGPISGQVVDLEQHPFIGRNPPKDATTIPTKK
ncbi:MAG: SDR family NAD(P)-dependent oxidoreductase [Chitinophagaceae bacterium]|jgi:NAD(P)-dependent dehydrogenase (short-subunit alcohol dehydrogenase family)